jgi:integrase
MDATPSGELVPADSSESDALLVGIGTLGQHEAVADAIKEAIVRPNTRRAFRADWAVWEQYCARDGIDPMTVSPALLVTFVHWLTTDEPDRPRSAPATITRRLAGILDGWRRGGAEIPRDVTKDARRVIAEYDRFLRREGESRGRGKSGALTIPELLAMSQVCADHGLVGLRDRAILVLGFSIAARRAILSAMNAEDVREDSDQGLVIWVRDDKTGEREVAVPYGSDPLTCPVRTWKGWVTASGITSGRLFRSIARGGRMGASISGDAINQMVKLRAEQAGITRRLTAHSMRSGLATASRLAGKDARVIAEQGGWALNSATMLGYMQIADRFKDNAAKGIGL